MYGGGAQRAAPPYGMIKGVIYFEKMDEICPTVSSLLHFGPHLYDHRGNWRNAHADLPCRHHQSGE